MGVWVGSARCGVVDLGRALPESCAEEGNHSSALFGMFPEKYPFALGWFSSFSAWACALKRIDKFFPLAHSTEGDRAGGRVIDFFRDAELLEVIGRELSALYDHNLGKTVASKSPSPLPGPNSPQLSVDYSLMPCDRPTSNPRRALMIAGEIVDAMRKISGYLEYASTVTRKLLSMKGPA